MSIADNLFRVHTNNHSLKEAGRRDAIAGVRKTITPPSISGNINNSTKHKLQTIADNLQPIYDAGQASKDELKTTVRSTDDVYITDMYPTEHTMDVEYESTNLLQYPFPDGTVTVNGVTFTDNNDGSIIINGTPDDGTARYRLCSMDSIEGGTYYFTAYTTSSVTWEQATIAFTHVLDYPGSQYDQTEFSYADSIPDNSSYGTLNIGNNSPLYIDLCICGTVDNVMYIFGLKRLANTNAVTYLNPDTYSHLAVSVEHTKNLIEYPYYNLKPYASVTNAGVTYTENGDGSITLNGKSTANTAFSIAYIMDDIPSAKVVLSGVPDGSKSSTYYWKLNTTACYTEGKAYTASTYKGKILSFYIIKNKTFDNFVIRPQLEMGTTPTEMEPRKLEYYRYNSIDSDIDLPLMSDNIKCVSPITVIRGVVLNSDGSESYTIGSSSGVNLKCSYYKAP